MKGNAEACTVLVHAGTKKELTMKDNSGFTPFQLAYDKGHRNIAFLIVRSFGVASGCIFACLCLCFS